MKYTSLIKLKRNLLSKWLLPYILLLIVPLVSYGFMYTAARNIVHKQTQTSNRLALEQLKRDTDASLTQVRQAFAQLYFQDIFQSDGLQTTYDIYRTVKILSSVNTSYTSIHNIFLYDSQTDFIISPSNALDSRSYYAAINPFSNKSYEEFIEIVSSNTGDYEFFQSTVADIDGTAAASLVCHKTMNVANMQSNRFHIFVVIDIGDTYARVTSADAFDGGAFSIIDNRTGKIVLSYGDSSLIDTIRHDSDKSVISDASVGSGSEYTGYSPASSNIVISQSHSDAFDLSYYMLMPENHFWQDEHNIQRLFIIALLCCLFLGCLVIVSSSRSNYKPLKNLADMLHHKSSELNVDNLNAIYDGVNNLMEQYSSIVTSQNASLRAAFLQRFICGRENSDTLREHFETYNIHFVSEQFAVVLIYIEDFTRFFAGAENMSTDEKFRLSHLAFTNIFEETCESLCVPLYIDLNQTIGYIINFKPGAEQRSLIDTLEKTRSFVEEHFSIFTSIAVSDIVLSPDNVPMAYNQSLEALDYREVFGTDTVITYRQIAGLNGHSFYYPMDMEQQLINCVKAGDYDNAKSIIDTIYQNNFENHELSLNATRCLMFNIISTMIKALNAGNASLDEAFNGDLYISRLFECKSIQEHQALITELLNDLCKSHVRYSSDDTDRLVESVTKYLSEHYANINLSVATIAKQFGFHPTYLSNLYKKHTGKVLSDAIRETRVEAAKKLLREGCTVDATAAKCGFTNSKTFTRTFKAATGVTPGKYKDIL